MDNPYESPPENSVVKSKEDSGEETQAGVWCHPILVTLALTFWGGFCYFIFGRHVSHDLFYLVLFFISTPMLLFSFVRTAVVRYSSKQKVIGLLSICFIFATFLYDPIWWMQDISKFNPKVDLLSSFPSFRFPRNHRTIFSSAHSCIAIFSFLIVCCSTAKLFQFRLKIVGLACSMFGLIFSWGLWSGFDPFNYAYTAYWNAGFHPLWHFLLEL